MPLIGQLRAHAEFFGAAVALIFFTVNAAYAFVDGGPAMWWATLAVLSYLVCCAFAGVALERIERFEEEKQG